MKRIIINDVSITVGTAQEAQERYPMAWEYGPKLRLGWSGLYIFSHISWDDVAKMAGLKSYDFALPRDWATAQRRNDTDFEDKHYVWCYDGGSIFGRAVSLRAELGGPIYERVLHELTKGED